MSVIKGSDMMLFVGGKSIGFATSHSLSISADTKKPVLKIVVASGKPVKQVFLVGLLQVKTFVQMLQKVLAMMICLE